MPRRSSYELHDIEGGRAGLLAKFAYMRQLVASAVPAPTIRAAALQAIGDGPARNPAEDVRRIDAWLRTAVRYTRDPLGVELFIDPRILVHGGAGDCDDLVMLGAALLESVGHQTRFAAGGLDEEKWVHVWLEALTPAGWVAQDATAPPGVDPRGKFPRELREGDAARMAAQPQGATMNGNERRVPVNWHALTPAQRAAMASELSGFGSKLKKLGRKVTKPIKKIVPQPIRKVVSAPLKLGKKLMVDAPRKLIKKQMSLVGKLAPAAPVIGLIPGVGTAIAAGAVAVGAVAQRRAQLAAQRRAAEQQAAQEAADTYATAPPTLYEPDPFAWDQSYYPEPAYDYAAPVYNEFGTAWGDGSSTEWYGGSYNPPQYWNDEYGWEGALYGLSGFSLKKLFKKGKKAAKDYGGIALTAAASGALGTGMQGVVQQGMRIQENVQNLRRQLMPPQRPGQPPPPLRQLPPPRQVMPPPRPMFPPQGVPQIMAPSPPAERPEWLIPAAIGGGVLLLLLVMKK